MRPWECHTCARIVDLEADDYCSFCGDPLPDASSTHMRWNSAPGNEVGFHRVYNRKSMVELFDRWKCRRLIAPDVFYSFDIGCRQ